MAPPRRDVKLAFDKVGAASIGKTLRSPSPCRHRAAVRIDWQSATSSAPWLENYTQPATCVERKIAAMTDCSRDWFENPTLRGITFIDSC